MTQTRISLPDGMVTHVAEWADGVPGIDFSPTTPPQRVLKVFYPLDQFSRGYVYFRPKAARRLKVGDLVRMNGAHGTVRHVGKPEWVTDAGGPGSKRVEACRVTLSDYRDWEAGVDARP